MAPKNANIDGRAAQWEDFTPQGRRIASELIGETGHAPARAAERLARGGPVNGQSETHAQKTAVKLESLSLVTPKLRDAKVTLQTAANRRVSHWDNAVTNEHGDPEGSGWYFQHHRDIAAAAQRSGYDTRRAITASAVMSPNNAPENEKAAVGALMDAHARHTVRITPELARAVNKRLPARSDAPKLGKGHIGRDVPFAELHPDHIAALSSGDFRDKKKPESKIRITTSAGEGTGRLLTDISRGGTKENISKAINILRGSSDPETAIDPHSMPKVWSYHRAIQNAVPNSPQHVEYMSRVGMATGHGQGALDLYGLRHSREGILDPEGHTAEDTWQNAITSGQQMKAIPTGRNGRSSMISPAKTYGSETGLGYISRKKNEAGESVDPDARIKPPAVQHAFNNKATRMGAAKVTKREGVEGAGLPAVAMQEVGWTQARREAAADPEFNQRQAAAAAPEKTPEVTGQMGLFHDRRRR